MPDSWDIIDVHIHLARDVAEEKVVYGQPGWPDAWYRKNGERIPEFLEYEGLSNFFAINIMDTNRMMRNRLERMPAAESHSEETRTRLRAEMLERLNRFNDWVCEWSKTQAHVVPFIHCDIGVYYD